MTAITAIHGREILDSRGNPTVEVDVLLETGSCVVRQFLQGPPLARMRPLNYGMGMKNVLAGKVF